MGILIFGYAYIHNDSADGVMPTEENNFLVAVKKLSEDYNNTEATKTILHSLGLFTNSFSMMPKSFESYYDSLIQIAKNINEQKVNNSPLYSYIIESLWPILTRKVHFSCFYFIFFL